MSKTKQERQQQQLRDIEALSSHDIALGRGRAIQKHPGNQMFHEIICKHKQDYQSHLEKKDKKSHHERKKIIAKVVDEIYSLTPPGRFLQQDAKTKRWHDIGRKEALTKTRQTFCDVTKKSYNTTASDCDLTRKKNSVKPHADLTKTSASKLNFANINEIDESRLGATHKVMQCTALSKAIKSSNEEKVRNTIFQCIN